MSPNPEPSKDEAARRTLAMAEEPASSILPCSAPTARSTDLTSAKDTNESVGFMAALPALEER